MARETTAVSVDQDVFDARASRGEVGALERRPYCDAKGRFVAFDCVPTQTCFCQSEEGERLFGEVLYTGPLQNMPCGCSRFNEQIRKLISTKVPFPVPGPRCTADGNFNPVQCIDRICYCMIQTSIYFLKYFGQNLLTTTQRRATTACKKKQRS
ncbi:unnamed protein product [Leptidea sinapis]|uniref:Thyroglobulin type-1 domain-containing protein n=1 Tax=Leptidea sinapis TaxID=189913 RepID=A0A5E4QWB3_9NEOP|nr:unnamed protein product [Leptidea sinapis]